MPEPGPRGACAAFARKANTREAVMNPQLRSTVGRQHQVGGQAIGLVQVRYQAAIEGFHPNDTGSAFRAAFAPEQSENVAGKTNPHPARSENDSGGPRGHGVAKTRRSYKGQARACQGFFIPQKCQQGFSGKGLKCFLHCLITTATAGPAVFATTTAAGGRSLFTRLGHIHGQGASAHILAVQSARGLLRFLVGAHGHETKAAGTIGHAIHDQAGVRDCAMRGECVSQVIFSGVEGKIPDK